MSRLDSLVDVLSEAPDEVFLQPHNVPDPDAIASCLGLRRLLAERGIDAEIVYDSEIEKANALEMIELFDVPMRPFREVATLGGEDWAVLVDVQKENANVTDMPTEEVAVIDHHGHNGFDDYRYADIRPEAGACSSLIAEYYFEAEIPIPRLAATALTYGIMMDTDNLTRGVGEIDIEMFYRLFRFADFEMITRLRANQISLTDLRHYSDAFRSVEIYGETAFLRISDVNDSLLGSAGDIVLTIAGVNVVVAYSVREQGIKYSVRSVNPKVPANALIRSVVDGYGVGGGHETMAGGFLPIDSLPPDHGIDTFTRVRTISFLDGVMRS